MRKTNKLQAANLEGNADDVEAAFYRALQKGDIDKLMACWADEDDIVCIHPGGLRVIGAVAIRATFEPGRSTDEKISAVQYTRYPLSAEAKAAFEKAKELVKKSGYEGEHVTRSVCGISDARARMTVNAS